MRDYITYSIALCLSLSSCIRGSKNNSNPVDSNNNKVNHAETNNDSIQRHRSKNTLKSMLLNDTTLKYDHPSITNLPFGPKSIKNPQKIESLMTLDFYEELTGKNMAYYHMGKKKFTDTYRLPEIRTYRFIGLSEEDVPKSITNKVNESFLIAKYKLRLPDFLHFEVYYMANHAKSFKDFPDEFYEYIQFPKSELYGILIVSNPSKKEANVLPIFYSRIEECVAERLFYIDKNYDISICDRLQCNDEQSEAWTTVDSKYKVSIDSTGQFHINQFFKR